MTVDSKTLFVTCVRSEVIWPECAAQRERKAQLQVGAVMAENSHSKRTHWKVKHTAHQASKKRTLYPCELSASQPDRSRSDSGRSTNHDGVRHRGSCQYHQRTYVPFHMAPRSTSPPTILNQTADIQWRGVESDWQHFCTCEL